MKVDVGIAIVLLSISVAEAGDGVPPVLVTTPSPSPSSTAPSSDAVALFGEDIMKLRDPFRRLDFRTALAHPKSDLEQFPVDQFKLVGITTGPNHMRALLMAPNGKTYLASVNSKIGLRGGVIRKITPEAVYVREKVVNIIGQEENVDMEIALGAAVQAGGPTGSP